MAYKELEVAPVKNGGEKGFAFEYAVTLAAISNGDWLIIPDDIKSIAVTLSFTDSAEGKVQTTTDKVETVKLGSPVAVDWTSGVVSATTSDATSPVTALRLSQTSIGGGSGTVKMTLRAQ